MSLNSQDNADNSNELHPNPNNADDESNMSNDNHEDFVPALDLNHVMPVPEHNQDIELSDSDNENVENDVADDELVYAASEEDDDDYWNEIHNVDGDDLDSFEQTSEDDQEDEDNGHSPSTAFDHELPIRHSYLGEGMEPLQGRVLLDEDTILEVPLIVMGLHLVPGQTLPMTVYHTGFQNAIRRSVVNDRLVGLVNNGIGSIDGRTVVNRGALGTLAEIYEFQEEDESEENVLNLLQGSSGFNFAFKAKGRQRFNVCEIRRQADGNLMGKIKIRPEVVMHPLVMEVILQGGARFTLPTHLNPSSSDVSQVSSQVIKEVEATEETSKKVYETENSKSLNALVVQNKNRRNVYRHYSVFMPFPAFVYEFYDEKILVERVHKKLRNDLKGITESDTNIPLDASELSFWLAQNFIMDDSIRLKIMKMDSAIQRLRFELNLLDNMSQVISCRHCHLTIADHSDIFAMSKEGPQGTYVNPQGFVHETLTVHKAKEIIYRGLPSTESSWFPGYSWTVIECRGCRNHLGWKFSATGRLIPKKFWGLARKSVTFKYNFNPESNDPDLLERRQSRTSTNATTVNNGYHQENGQLTLPPLLPPYPFPHPHSR